MELDAVASLTPKAVAALTLLRGTSREDTRSAKSLANRLWPDKIAECGTSRRRGGLYRSAGGYYAKLAKIGLCAHYMDDFSSGYYLTAAGARALSQLDEDIETMSGYDTATGIFELNEAKMRRYLRKPIDQAINEPTLSGYCAALFREAGFQVLRKHAYGFDVIADDAQVWEVLSGTPATFGRASPPAAEVYEAWLRNREWFNATDLGKSLEPKIGPAKVNLLLEQIGFQERHDGVWKPTDKAAGYFQLRAGANVYGNGAKEIPEWHRSTIDVLQPLVMTKAKK